MALYEYLCGSCGKLTEVIQSHRDKPLKICPHCGAKALKKQFSAPAIQFKGSGFYITDYGANRGAGGAKEKSESSSAESAKSESGKSETGKSESKEKTGSPEKPAEKEKKKESRKKSED